MLLKASRLFAVVELPHRVPIDLRDPQLLVRRILHFSFDFDVFAIESHTEALSQRDSLAMKVLKCSATVQTQAPPRVRVVKVGIDPRITHLRFPLSTVCVPDWVAWESEAG